MAANAVVSASTFKRNSFLISTNLPKIVLMQHFHGYVVPLYNYSNYYMGRGGGELVETCFISNSLAKYSEST